MPSSPAHHTHVAPRYGGHVTISSQGAECSFGLVMVWLFLARTVWMKLQQTRCLPAFELRANSYSQGWVLDMGKPLQRTSYIMITHNTVDKYIRHTTVSRLDVSLTPWALNSKADSELRAVALLRDHVGASHVFMSKATLLGYDNATAQQVLWGNPLVLLYHSSAMCVLD